MAQTQVSERLIRRIRWLGSPDPTWIAEDGRPTTPWAVAQAITFLKRITEAGLPYDVDPQMTATARGGIEFFWKIDTGDEIDVIIPADSDGSFEVTLLHRQADGTMAEDEREPSSLSERIAGLVGSLESARG